MICFRDTHVENSTKQWRGEVEDSTQFIQLMAASIPYQVGDRHHLETMLAAESHEVRHTGHTTIFFENLTDHPGTAQSRQKREVRGRLGVSSAL